MTPLNKNDIVLNNLVRNLETKKKRKKERKDLPEQYITEVI